MPNKMLIDATHPEETRVVVLRGNRVEEFDFESANRRQLRGNIYLAKVTRVEPSLQAAFVDYGGNRHGFLAFSEIHPDYYQIPIADRQALIDEEERAHRDAEAEADRRAGMRRHPHHRAAARPTETLTSAAVDAEAPEFEAGPSSYTDADHSEVDADRAHDLPPGHETPSHPAEASDAAESHGEPIAARAPSANEGEPEPHGNDDHPATFAEAPPLADDEQPATPDSPDGRATAGHGEDGAEAAVGGTGGSETAEGEAAEGDRAETAEGDEEEIVESVGGADAMEEVPDRAPRLRRQYKIQEVIKRRQIMLVQVVKEERGTKGAALTTYLSLAGRYCVLMPNTARGGGISRKITNVQDRKRLKEIAQELEVPEGMGVILRTAGAARTKTEIKRDFEYLLRAWETVRDLTLKSTAPTLVYEEGSLVKRSIRDLYNKEIDEVIVAGDEAYRDAREFMGMLMPSHAKNVKPYREHQPLFARYGIESQLDAMFSPVVQLRSGGYIVLNQAEALVAIDVNSGRATREHHIEDTALKTNLEAAEEIARQLRLRDLAGLIVIDFIDMDEKRNNRSVERRLKDCLKHDRARIQVGRISHFGLLEMSRQRIRASVLESSTDKCPHCGGTGHVRSIASVSLQCLRMIEEQLQRGATHNIILRTRSEIALYVLNQKRTHLHDLEQRYQIAIAVTVDPSISGQLPFVIEKGEQVHSLEQARALAAQPPIIPLIEHDETEVPIEEEEAEEETADTEAAEGETPDAETGEVVEIEDEDIEAGNGMRAAASHDAEESDPSRRRRRRRRGRRDDSREGGFAPEGAPRDHGRGRGHGRWQGSDRAAAPRTGEVPGVGGEPNPWQQPHEISHGGEPQADTEAGEPNESGLAGENGHRADVARSNGDAEGRRRRRRGRRGGRRNRRDEGEFRPFENGAEPIEEEVAHAVADLGGPPDETRPAATAGHGETAPEAPAHYEAAPADEVRHQEPPMTQSEPAAPAATPEPPRRRSTVREPVQFGTAASAPTPPSVPTVPPTIAEPSPPDAPPSQAGAAPEGTAPRRAGWWAKRIFGDKQ